MNPRRRGARAARAACAALVVACGAAHAGSPAFCDRDAHLSAGQEDVLFRFAAEVKSVLDASGAGVALVSRSGLDLSRFHIRYSHAGLSLKDSPNGAWSVRQLYFACDEGRPRVFDQGLSGFLLGTDDPDTGYLSVVLLPPGPAARAEAAGRDNAESLRLLARTYSANAYAFGRRYQNCNQWLIELLATAWAGGGLPAPAGTDKDGDPPASLVDADGSRPGAWPRTPPDPSLPDAVADPQRWLGVPEDGAGDDPAGGARLAAQRWLWREGYRPADVRAGVLTPLASFLPYLHAVDHPPAALHRGVFEVSLPASIEAFVHARLPGATRVEFCHAGRRMVVHRGWDRVADGCRPGPGDRVVALD